MWWQPLILLCFVIAVRSGPIADFAPCDINDKDCMVKMGNIIFKDSVTGVSSLNIESLDPMFHEEVTADLASIKYKLTKSTVKGFKDCKVSNMVLSIEKHTLRLVLDCPHFDMFGTYEIDGSILTLPIQGKGDYNMECKDYNIVIDSNLKITEKDGKKYLSMKSYNYSGELQGGGINMKNLFNGQKELADTVLKVMNENWVTVSKELQGPVFKVNINKLIKNFNKYLKKKPIDSLIVQ